MKRCPICKREFESAGRCPEDGATLVDEDLSDPMIGSVIQGYRIERQLGSGGVGMVYLAKQLLLDRPVAFKVLRDVPGVRKDEMLHRFLREARLLSQVSHPNVVGVIDFGNTEDGTAFLAMEYVTGPTLKVFAEERGGLHVSEIRTIMLQLCAAVQSAHDMHIVHRDLKPQNVIVADEREGQERIKLLDFGIGKSLSDGTQDFTNTNVVLGTPGYLAPEQIRNAKGVDARADIYALGAILYFLVTGRNPYRGQQAAAILAHQLMEKPAPLQIEELHDPSALIIEPIIQRAMEVDPAVRYQTADELKLAIRSLGSELGGDADGATVNRAMSSAAVRPSPPPTVSVPGSGRVRNGARLGLIGTALSALLVAMGWWSYAASSSNMPPPPAPVAGPPVRGVAEGTVTVGMTAAFSGGAKEIGRAMKVGLTAAFEAVNRHGGINGRKVELVALDDGYDPARARANAEELIGKTNVFAMVGNVGTPTTEAILPRVLESGTLLFAPVTGSEIVRKDPPDRYVFNYRASYSEEARVLIRYLVEIQKVPAAKIAILAQDDSFGESGVRGFKEALRAHGIAPDRVAVVRYERNTRIVEPAVATIVNRWKEHELGAVVVAATYGASARFTREIRDAGITVPVANLSFVGSDALAEEFKEIGVKSGKGVIAAQVVPRFDGYSTLAERFRRDLSETEPQEVPSSIALEGYVAGNIFLEGLRRTGGALTQEGVLAHFESMKGYDVGSGSAVDFGPSDHQASHKVWGIELDESGQWHELDLGTAS